MARDKLFASVNTLLVGIKHVEIIFLFLEKVLESEEMSIATDVTTCLQQSSDSFHGYFPLEISCRNNGNKKTRGLEPFFE